MTTEQSTTTVIDTLHAGVIVNASNGLTRTLSVERGALDGTLNVVAQRDTGALGDGRVTAGLAISRAAWLQIRETADAILGTGEPAYPSYTRSPGHNQTPAPEPRPPHVPDPAARVFACDARETDRVAIIRTGSGEDETVILRTFKSDAGDWTGPSVHLRGAGRTHVAARILGLEPEQVANFSQQAKSTPEPEPVKLVDLLPEPDGELTPGDVLRRAATIVEAPGRWVQGKLATDAEGRSTDHVSATCACAIGALMLADPDARSIDGTYIAYGGERYRQAADALADRITGSIPRWNDAKGRTAEEVAATMRQAADDLEGPKTPLGKIVARAADILAEPGAWTQGDFARRADGNGVSARSNDATCFCAIGALERAAQEVDGRRGYPFATRAAERGLRSAGRLHFAEGIVSWNDAADRTQEEVVDGLRAAVKYVEAEAGAGQS